MNDVTNELAKIEVYMSKSIKSVDKSDRDLYRFYKQKLTDEYNIIQRQSEYQDAISKWDKQAGPNFTACRIVRYCSGVISAGIAVRIMNSFRGR